MTAAFVEIDKLFWESWPAHPLVNGHMVPWKRLPPAPQTPTPDITVGLARIDPGGIFPKHRRPTGEVCQGIAGEGSIEVEGDLFRLLPGRLIFIPPLAWHRAGNPGPERFEFTFAFPASSFDDVQYDFAAA